MHAICTDHDRPRTDLARTWPLPSTLGSQMQGSVLPDALTEIFKVIIREFVLFALSIDYVLFLVFGYQRGE